MFRKSLFFSEDKEFENQNSKISQLGGGGGVEG